VGSTLHTNTLQEWGEQNRSGLVDHRMLAVDCAAASGEQTDHCPVERRQIIGLAAGHPVAVLNHFPIHPVAPRVADVVLDGVVLPRQQRRSHTNPKRERGSDEIK
jgi:hypothetical protein